MSPLRLAVVAGVSLFAVPAFAQTVGQGPHQDALVHVQTSFNFFVAGPTGQTEEAQKLRDNAQRTIYEMAAGECKILLEVLAKDCRLESISSNIGRQQFGPQQQQDGYSVNGSMNLQVTLK